MGWINKWKYECELMDGVKILALFPKKWLMKSLVWQQNRRQKVYRGALHCCDRKSRAECAQGFALWQQATIEYTCHDHSIIACSRHIYVWCCSLRTSRSWWITHLTQHHRRGCNNICGVGGLYRGALHLCSGVRHSEIWTSAFTMLHIQILGGLGALFRKG